MNYNFKKGKKLTIFALSVVTALSLCSCRQIESMVSSNHGVTKSTDTYTVQHTDSLTIDSSSYESSSDVVTSSTNNTDVNPTIPDDSTMETMTHGEPITQDDYEAISSIAYAFYNGMDSPVLLDFIRYYYNDDSLTIDDVDYLCHIGHINSDKPAGYNSGFTDFVQSLVTPPVQLDINFIRYVYSRNSLRLWEDEFDDTLMNYLFPEYASMVDSNEKSAYMKLDDIRWSKEVRDFYEGGSHDYSIASLYEYEANNNFGVFDFITYDMLGNFNNSKYTVVLEDADIVEIRRNGDGDIVVVPNEMQLNKYNNGFRSIPGCENIDISKVETRDDLIASMGIETVELYDQVYDQILQRAEEYRMENNIQSSYDDNNSSRSRG